MRKLTTRQKLENGSGLYPCVQVHWTEDDDQLGWHGELITINKDQSIKEKKHRISVRQTLPIGLISFSFDECSGGAWEFGGFEGTSITERDLQWATSWSILALKSKELKLKLL